MLDKLGGAEAKAGGAIAAKRGDFLFSRVALAVARKAHARLKVALGDRGIILVGTRGNTAQVLQHPEDDYTIRLLDAVPNPARTRGAAV